MKLRISKDWAYSSKQDNVSITEVMKDTLTAAPYSYEGQLEGMEQEIGKLRDTFSQLVEQLHDKAILRDKDILELVGFGWEVDPNNE